MYIPHEKYQYYSDFFLIINLIQLCVNKYLLENMNWFQFPTFYRASPYRDEYCSISKRMRHLKLQKLAYTTPKNTIIELTATTVSKIPYGA